MKIHTFVRDTKLMEKYERDAVAKRERVIKRQQQKAVEEKETQETPQKTRKKKKKEAV